MPDIRDRTEEGAWYRLALQTRVAALEKFTRSLSAGVQQIISAEKRSTEAVQDGARAAAMGDGLRRFSRLPVAQALGEFGESKKQAEAAAEEAATKITESLRVMIVQKLSETGRRPGGREHREVEPRTRTPRGTPPQELSDEEKTIAEAMVGATPSADLTMEQRALLGKLLGHDVRASDDDRRAPWVRKIGERYVVYNPYLPGQEPEKGKGKGGKGKGKGPGKGSKGSWGWSSWW